MAHSLRGRLLWWLLLPLAVFVLIAAAMAYDAARRTADLVQDSTLVASARTIGEDIEWRNGLPVADVPPAALEIFESPSRDSVFYKVIDSDGRLLAGNPALDVVARHGAEPIAYDTTLD
ncbi:two-component sensor kinase N-terminal domain protein, partial [Burkholderia multivorans ATCC BAA-247]